MAGERAVAVVTGGNRGIGLETCRELARLGYTVVLCARSVEDGERAAAELRAEGGDVRAHALDLRDDGSIAALAAWVRGELGAVRALVNNAGVYLDEGVRGVDVAPETVRETFETNLYGPLRLCQLLAPLMGRGGRIVNVSSGYGEVEQTAHGGVLAYKLSKLALNGMTRILAAELRGAGVKVNAMDPGWVRTRMGGPGAPRRPEEAAETAVWLATLPDDGPTGAFFRDRRMVEW